VGELPATLRVAWFGVACGLLVYSPFHSWRHEHAVHHATAGGAGAARKPR